MWSLPWSRRGNRLAAWNMIGLFHGRGTQVITVMNRPPTRWTMRKQNRANISGRRCERRTRPFFSGQSLLKSSCHRDQLHCLRASRLSHRFRALIGEGKGRGVQRKFTHVEFIHSFEISFSPVCGIGISSSASVDSRTLNQIELWVFQRLFRIVHRSTFCVTTVCQ